MVKFIAARQSLLTALVVVVVLTVWMVSGRDASTAAPAEDVATVPERTTEISVRVRTLTAESVAKELVMHGTTEPARAVTLRAEVDGRVTEVNVAKGAQVKSGDVIVRIDARERHALLKEAQAAVRSRELQHQAAVELKQQSFQSDTEVAEALANLETARAELTRIQVEIGNTVVRAPFDAVLDERSAEVGDYLSAGDAVARVLEQTPLLVVGHVAQQKMQDIKVGSQGSASLVTGQQLDGTVRFVASESDAQTRTFRVELEVPNKDGAVAAGLTGEIRIQTQSLNAHFLPTSLLSLGAGDQLGVKAVGDDSMVVFHEIEIVSATPAGLWVTGLPRVVQVITVGQGFVRAGDKVDSVLESEISEPQGRAATAEGGTTGLPDDKHTGAAPT